MLATARSGLPLKFVAQAGGIAYDVFLDWRGRDPEFDRALEEARLASVQERWKQIMKLGKGTQEKPGDWKALAWSLERTEPSSFARPELQLSLQANIVQNNLTITIAPEEVREIEAQAEPVRQKVREMMAAYRPGLGNGNGHGERTVDVPPSPVKPEELEPITSKADKPEFWFAFASGSGMRPVSKEVAIYVASTIVNETVGRGIGNQAIVAFKSEQPTVADVLAVIDRLCGGPAGWQHLQKKAGIQPGPGA
jgi:hypothetical protein